MPLAAPQFRLSPSGSCRAAKFCGFGLQRCLAMVFAVVTGVSGIGFVILLETSASAGPLALTTSVEVRAPIEFSTSPLKRGACGQHFVPRTLPHTTKALGAHVLPYDTNGAGLALGDLNSDGRVDIVLGDLRGTTSILWNKGNFLFERSPLEDVDGALPESNTRAVQIVDVDNDGRLDIATTHTGGGISVWHNNGDKTFVSGTVDEAISPAYAMVWDDLDSDGDLDLVTSSYDALLEKEKGNSFLNSAGGGVNVFIKRGKSFTVTRLQRATQTLAMTLFDVTGDGRRDLVVGNDFGVPDSIWEIKGDDPTKWKPVTPFRRITKNTMGFAIGDVGNDGRLDLFATDMKPNLADPRVAAAWMPLMERSFQKLQRSSTQRAENVLQIQSKSGSFENKGYTRNVDATGWSWSASFGDLNNDGLEDLYVVNGMIDHEVLPYLPSDAITEANVVFLAESNGKFRRVHNWGLDAMESGRSMALADLDNDGRLDVVVNNLNSPAMVFENRLCSAIGTGSVGSAGAAEIRLRWNGKQNLAAFGSMIRVHTAAGTFTRLVSPTGGYLTGLDGTVHVGLGSSKVNSIDVTWPDGATSRISRSASQGGLENQLVTITRAGSSATGDSNG